MIPYIWNKIDWKFVFKILLGIINWISNWSLFIEYFYPQTTQFICLFIIIFFSILLMKGYSNQKLIIIMEKDFTG